MKNANGKFPARRTNKKLPVEGSFFYWCDKDLEYRSGTGAGLPRSSQADGSMPAAKLANKVGVQKLFFKFLAIPA